MPRSIVGLAVAGSLCGVLAGCTSAGTPPPDEQPPSPRPVLTVGSAGSNTSGHAGDASRVVYATDTYAGINARINGPASSILDTLSGIYQNLGIPISTRMGTTGQIGNRNYKVPGHRLKDVQISRIVDCGQGSIGGSRADADAITLNVITTIRPATDSGSIVNTYVSAVARPYASSSDPVQCASSGTLERMINDRLMKAFGGSGIN